VQKPEGKTALGRPRRKWEHNIKMDLREIEWGGKISIHLTQDRDNWRTLVNTAMNIWDSKKARKFE
jgi:hypothetical protein